MTLDALDRPATTEYAELILGGPISLALSRRLWELTHGNPLFVREFVVSIEASQRLINRNGTWDTDEDFKPTERLHDIVGNRVDALDSTAQRALGIVAVTEPAEMDLLDSLGVGDSATPAREGQARCR